MAPQARLRHPRAFSVLKRPSVKGGARFIRLRRRGLSRDSIWLNVKSLIAFVLVLPLQGEATLSHTSYTSPQLSALPVQPAAQPD